MMMDDLGREITNIEVVHHHHKGPVRFSDLLALEDRRYQALDYLRLDCSPMKGLGIVQGEGTSDAAVEARKRKSRAQWRLQICEWIYQVVDEFDLSREIAYVAMSYVDRFYSATSSSVVDRAGVKDHIQLLSMAALFLAMKLYDKRELLVPETESTMQTILKLGRNKFTFEELERMEVELLQRLQWLVHPPTPQMFANFLLEELPPQPSAIAADLKELTMYLVELSVLDYRFVTIKASEVAAACLLNAADIVGLSESSTHNLRNVVKIFEFSSFDFIRRRLRMLYANANDNGTGEVSQNGQTRVDSPVSVLAGPFQGE